MRRSPGLAAALLLMLSLVVNAAPSPKEKAGASHWFYGRVYSSILENRDEGESYGLEVTLIPYSGGEKILWRPASGRVFEPLLLEVEELERARKFRFTVPPVQEPEWVGEWEIEFTESSARLVGPKGRRILLKRTHW